jgi:hypothetical protein
MFPTRAKLNHSKTKKFLTEFISDDKQKKARIYWGNSRLKVNVDTNGEKAIMVNELDTCFTIDFYHKNRKEGTLVYPDKTIDYVENAAENWVLGIFDVNDLRYHVDQQKKDMNVL